MALPLTNTSHSPNALFIKYISQWQYRKTYKIHLWITVVEMVCKVVLGELQNAKFLFASRQIAAQCLLQGQQPWFARDHRYKSTKLMLHSTIIIHMYSIHAKYSNQYLLKMNQPFMALTPGWLFYCFIYLYIELVATVHTFLPVDSIYTFNNHGYMKSRRSLELPPQFEENHRMDIYSVWHDNELIWFWTKSNAILQTINSNMKPNHHNAVFFQIYLCGGVRCKHHWYRLQHNATAIRNQTVWLEM